MFKEGSTGPTADDKWPLSIMEEALAVVTNNYYNYPRRPNPRWSVFLYHSVAVYRGEVLKLRAADAHKLRLEIEAQKANQGRTPALVDDDDIGE